MFSRIPDRQKGDNKNHLKLLVEVQVRNKNLGLKLFTLKKIEEESYGWMRSDFQDIKKIDEETH